MHNSLDLRGVSLMFVHACCLITASPLTAARAMERKRLSVRYGGARGGSFEHHPGRCRVDSADTHLPAAV